MVVGREKHIGGHNWVTVGGKLGIEGKRTEGSRKV